MSEFIRAAAKKWFYESFDCDLLEKMEKAGLIAQAEGFSISVMAELELEMESAFDAAKSELAALRKKLTTVHFVCDRLPDQEGCRFIELEDPQGYSLGEESGKWEIRPDGLAQLVVTIAKSVDEVAP